MLSNQEEGAAVAVRRQLPPDAIYGMMPHGNRFLLLNMPVKPKNIVFFHPDLGIGGAERLVIDAAVGLQDLGHKVTIFTSYCDRGHCFDEARNGTPTTSAMEMNLSCSQSVSK
jgi:hypothetical protein